MRYLSRSKFTRTVGFVVSLAVIGATYAPAIWGQASTVIEAASIKPSDPALCKDYPVIDGHGLRYDLTCVRTKYLIQIAYSVKDFQILDAPGWLDADRYNIAVKVSSGDSVPDKPVTELTDAERQAGGERLRAMLRSLLADRFQLKTHRETRESPIYVLTVARSGVRLRSSTSDISGGLRAGRGVLAGSHTDIAFFAQTLAQIVGRPVVDQTGLGGKYDFELKWTPDMSAAAEPFGDAGRPQSSADTNSPNIFTAIQEQLGLKLSSGKGPVDVIEVDHAEKPSGN
ncbi:MAG TPA: TIGR03435 family protein [Bryobacteraceae bacterium]|nr:TIGR03435 family protein [Bryobacteraceae bacterium]